MKKALFFLCFLFVYGNAEEKIQWIHDYTIAEKKADEEIKPLLLFFSGSDWCPWCKKLEKRIFENPDFYQPLNDKIIFAYIDFPKKTPIDQKIALKNQFLMNYFHIDGFPTLVLIDKDKKLRAKIGYLPLSAAEYVHYLQSILEGANENSDR